MTNLAREAQFLSSHARAALFIAHPGHELMVHGWLELARPVVFVITDGSGRTNQSRLDSTTRVLEHTGAKRGRIYGHLTDRAAYSSILNHDFNVFTSVAEQLAGELIDNQIDYIAGDAVEGYNPTHDVCRLIINSAVEIAKARSNRNVANFEFPLVGRLEVDRAKLHPHDICLKLDDEAFARKMASARRYTVLANEVSEALKRSSEDSFREECLYHVDPRRGTPDWGRKPFYEQYGEEQVAKGYYEGVLGCREHIEPLAKALALANSD
jgi:hypothetical protein